MLMIHNWLCKNCFFFNSVQGFWKHYIHAGYWARRLQCIIFFNRPLINKFKLTPCTVWFIHLSFKKIRGFNELRWLNGHYVRRLSRLPTSWSWHSTKCHLSEGALKSDRPLWLSCSAGQGLSSPGSHPQRAFSLSGAECKSKTSNSTLFKFRIYPVQSQGKVRQNRGG